MDKYFKEIKIRLVVFEENQNVVMELNSSRLNLIHHTLTSFFDLTDNDLIKLLEKYNEFVTSVSTISCGFAIAEKGLILDFKLSREE